MGRYVNGLVKRYTRYGPNIDLVEGFEVVLPSGEITRVGSMAYAETDFGPFYRYITGPDLVGLFTKSNGAFGIVTKVAYQCLHRPKCWAFHSYYWSVGQIEDFTKAVMEITAAEVFESHFNDKWRFVSGLPPDCHFILKLVVNAENQLELKGKEQAVEEICETHGGTYLPQFCEDIYTRWPTIFHLGQVPSVLSVAVRRKDKATFIYILDELIYPTSAFPEVYNKILEVCKTHGFDSPRKPMIDGYPMKHLVISSQTQLEIEVYKPYLVSQFYKCQDEFRKWYGKKGGQFQYKFPPLVPDYCWTNQLSTLNLLRQIKGLLDPNNILSPGTFELGRHYESGFSRQVSAKKDRSKRF